jgi:peptidoglycan hydrolase CwlO-like protein
MEIKEIRELISLNEKQLKNTTEDVIIYKAALKDVLNTAFGADEHIESVARKLTSSFSMLEHYKGKIEELNKELPESEKAKDILFGGANNGR